MDLARPAVIRLVMDSLRYWVEEMHVDGFRFDLASVLGRAEDGTFRTGSGVLRRRLAGPGFSRVTLIAEPWDLGTYQVGNFPIDWSEWNGRFRDTVRKFARGDPGSCATSDQDHRVGRPLPGRRPVGVQQRQLRHLPRRLHPARPRHLRDEAQRGQPRVSGAAVVNRTEALKRPCLRDESGPDRFEL